MIARLKKGIRNWKKRRKLIEFYSQFITKGDLCFDIGSNLGNRTKIFVHLGARVVSVEPVPACCEVLAGTYKDTLDVFIVQKAVGKQAGKANLNIGNYLEVSSLSQDFMTEYGAQADYDIHWDQKIEVDITTLDELIQEFGIPVFCKIDVEGFEPEVFQGLSQPLPALSFEYNSKLKFKALDCLDQLTMYDHLEYNFSAYESLIFSLPNWYKGANFRNFIENLDGSILTGDVYVRSRL